MVRVPSVRDQVGGSVQLQAPGVVPTQDQTGNQLQQTGRALQFAGQGVQRLGIDIKERNDVARISEADSLYGDFVRQRLNPRDGYRSLQGRAAGDQFDAVRRELDEKRDAIARTLQTDEQRQLFNRSAMVRAQQAYGLIESHDAQQTSIYEASQQAAAVKGHQADYLDSLTNPHLSAIDRGRAMAKSLDLMKRSVDSMTEDVAPEVRAQVLAEEMTRLHGGAVAGFIDEGDAQGASDYLASNAEHIEPTLRRKLSGQVKRMQANQKSADLAEKIMANAPQGGTVPERRLYALETAKWTIEGKKLSAEDSARLNAHLRKLYEQEAETYAVTQNVEVDKAVQWFTANGQRPYDDYPGSDALDASGGGAKVQKWLGDAFQRKTDAATWTAVELLSEGVPLDGQFGDLAGRDWGTLTPNQFRAVFEHRLSEADFKVAQARWAKARGDQLDPKSWQILGDAEIIKHTMAGLKLDLDAVRDDPAGKEAQRYMRAKLLMQDWLNAQNFPDSATARQKQEALDAFVVDTMTRSDNWAIDSTVATVTALTGEDGDKLYADVPAVVDGVATTRRVYAHEIDEHVRANIVETLEAFDMKTYGNRRYIPEQRILKAWADLGTPDAEEWENIVERTGGQVMPSGGFGDLVTRSLESRGGREQGLLDTLRKLREDEDAKKKGPK